MRLGRLASLLENQVLTVFLLWVSLPLAASLSRKTLRA